MSLKGENTSAQAYLISKAKESLDSEDNFMAKSWFLTASNLFPNSLQVQFERYQLAKKEKNISECSKIFVKLLNLPTNDLIEEEVERIVEQINQSTCNDKNQTSKQASTNGNDIDENELFHRQLFQSLPQPLQYKLLLGVASKSKSKLQCCQLMLLIMKRFPEKINEHALKVIEMVIQGEQSFEIKQESNKKSKVYKNKENAPECKLTTAGDQKEYFGHFLIFELLPLVLSTDSNLILNQDHVQELLENLFKFFLQQSSLGRVSEKETLLIDDLERIDQTQKKIREIFHLIRGKMNWEPLIDMYEMEPYQVQYNKLSDFYLQNSLIKTDCGSMDLSCPNRVINPTVLKQVFLSAFLLFLIYLDQYIRQTVSKLVVVQHHLSTGICVKEKPLPNAKKRKIAEQSKPCKSVCNNESLQTAFSGANKFFEFLNQDHHLQQELFRLIQMIGLNQYKSYETFIIDTYIYRGDTENLLNYFHKNKSNSLKSCIQLVSTSIAKGNHSMIIENCVELARLTSQLDQQDLPEISDPVPDSLVKQMIVGENGINQLSFVPYSKYEVLAYNVDVLIICLRETMDLSSKPADTLLGHLIVLSQFAWPRYLSHFVHVLNLLKMHFHNSKFVYPSFLEYVFNSDILEEFMSLAVSDELDIDLKIVNHASGSLKPKTMTTRGVNKNAKEEIRNALTNQIRTSVGEPDAELFLRFIVKELSTFTVAKVKETTLPVRKSARK